MQKGKVKNIYEYTLLKHMELWSEIVQDFTPDNTLTLHDYFWKLMIMYK